MARRLRPEAWQNWPGWVLPVIGFFALLWFLLRVIPKPSRASYPCQRAAFPLASAFVIWLMGLVAMAVGIRVGRRSLAESRWFLAMACLGAILIGYALMQTGFPGRARAGFDPIDEANRPIGLARGIYPGRVVWVHNPDATEWDPSLNNDPVLRYWDDVHTSATVVQRMMKDGVCKLAGIDDANAAWEALFQSFNRDYGRGDVGYIEGQTIAIKVNHVEQRSHAGNSTGTGDNGNKADLTPAAVLALLDQLVNHAGVPEQMITVADPSRFIADKEFDRCHAAFPGVRFQDSRFFNTSLNPGTAGRELVSYTSTAVLHYSATNPVTQAEIPSNKLPTCFYDADYLINLGVLKGHPQAGATLSGKNWYGALDRAPNGPHHDIGWMESRPDYGSYRSMVDMMGHRELGGKTMLNILDGLWGFDRHGTGSAPIQWQMDPFNGDYPSSLLLSQDPVAIDSVGLDFLRAEFADNMGGTAITGAIDDYMHEAAMADSPPSGTVYDPEGDGTTLASLGVHEHWNDPVERLYTRNLNKGSGIELVPVSTGYKRPVGELAVQTNPVSGGWTVEGPEGFVVSGSGDTDFGAVPTGRYVITWVELEGYVSPDPVEIDLRTGEEEVLLGVYRAQTSSQDVWALR